MSELKLRPPKLRRFSESSALRRARFEAQGKLKSQTPKDKQTQERTASEGGPYNGKQTQEPVASLLRRAGKQKAAPTTAREDF